MIKKAKRNSLKIFIEENESNDPFDDRIDQDNQQQELVRSYEPFLRNSSAIHIDTEEIEYLIDNTNVKKSPGQDYISNNMIKYSKTLILPVLHSLLNKCIQMGYFPREWKTTVLKILMKPNKSNVESIKSYRPISLTSNLSKIYEKVIKKKIYEYYMQNNLLSPKQHGFIKSKSTITALNNIIDIIMEHKTKELTALVTIDIAGAFDNAWWPAILKIIDEDNLPESLIRTIQSYFKSRKTKFTYENLTINKQITKGCPQGGPLSPLLWIILLNDLLIKYQVPNSEVNQYFDDIQNAPCNARNASQFWKIIKSFKQRTTIKGNIPMCDWEDFYRRLLSSPPIMDAYISPALTYMDPDLDAEISLMEVTTEISNLGKDKATGLDNIPNEAIKVLPDEYLILLTNIYNKILTTSSVPSVWTRTIIHPNFKNSDPNIPSNYRGISLFSNLSKLFTSILKTRLNNWI
ncbi:hypothetical protein LAZ67_22000078 [Cordylochernes scorpioides]|uniref:Reverse transcriptase domain-containing protein n=1 Tax=Cordylochernes scorpioides TaxID=51811 RepID=A0ABY6LN10_9ARAC|nr:hypothetical protein LAZ67_22000078 [Cordylochernes scorpioides]